MGIGTCPTSHGEDRKCGHDDKRTLWLTTTASHRRGAGKRAR
uniref:Uncharacterized protein n=1 Tax=Arundo donax TaxID=35708 RepID=A0A0A9H5K0_ARUDO